MAQSSRHSKSARSAGVANHRSATDRVDPLTGTDASLAGGRALWLLVVVPVLFNAVMLWPELATGVPTRNDSAFHLLMIRGASQALSSGQNVLDFWIPQLDLGFPQFLYYQNLPHLFVLAIHRMLFGTVPLETIFNVVRYVLLAGFPVTVYASMRRMKFSMAAAASSAAASSLISSNAHMGFEYNSYLWRGFGLYAQLWAMHLAFAAIAFLYTALRYGKGFVIAILSLAALALSHLLFAYMIAITSIIMFFAMWSRGTQLTRFVRLGVMGFFSIAITCYMLIPFALSSVKYMSTLPWVVSRGANVPGALRWYARGELLDFGRFPVLTLLSVVGVMAAIALIRRLKDEPTRVALVGFLVWSVLYLVPHAAFGPLGDIFPAHDGWVSARFISSFEIFAILVIGAAGEWGWQFLVRNAQVASQPSTSIMYGLAPFAFVGVALLVLLPAFVERGAYYAGNRRLIAATENAFAMDADLSAVLDTIKVNPAGRVYAGTGANWGALMNVGPTVRVNDILRFDGLNEVGVPYQSLSLASSMFTLFREGDPSSFDLLDVRWAIVPSTATVPAFYEPALRAGNYALYRIKTSGIAEYVSITAPVSASTQRALYEGTAAWYASDAVVNRKVLAWNYMHESDHRDAQSTVAVRCKDGGDVHVDKSAQGYLALTASCDAASALMLKFNFHPNWHVTVDGVSTPTIMVAPAFVGFKVPAGRHAIVAQYVATPMKLPLLLLGLAMFAVALYFRDRLDTIPNRIASRFS